MFVSTDCERTSINDSFDRRGHVLGEAVTTRKVVGEAIKNGLKYATDTGVCGNLFETKRMGVPGKGAL